jgi:hypothetical protein
MEIRPRSPEMQRFDNYGKDLDYSDRFGRNLDVNGSTEPMRVSKIS